MLPITVHKIKLSGKYIPRLFVVRFKCIAKGTIRAFSKTQTFSISVLFVGAKCQVSYQLRGVKM